MIICPLPFGNSCKVYTVHGSLWLMAKGVPNKCRQPSANGQLVSCFFQRLADGLPFSCQLNTNRRRSSGRLWPITGGLGRILRPLRKEPPGAGRRDDPAAEVKSPVRHQTDQGLENCSITSQSSVLPRVPYMQESIARLKAAWSEVARSNPESVNIGQLITQLTAYADFSKCVMYSSAATWLVEKLS